MPPPLSLSMDAAAEDGADDSSKPAIATRSRASLVDVDLSFSALDASAPVYPGLRACDRCRDRKGELSSCPRLFLGAKPPSFAFPDRYVGTGKLEIAKQQEEEETFSRRRHSCNLLCDVKLTTPATHLLQNSPLRPQKSALHDLHEAERNLHHDPSVASPTRRQTLDRSRPRPRGHVPLSCGRGGCFGDSTPTTHFVLVVVGWISATGAEE